MKKLSLLLTGAVMLPSLALADNMAISVAHMEAGSKSQRIEVSDGLLGKGNTKVGKDFTMSSWVMVTDYTIKYTANNCGASFSSALVMGHRARCHDNTNGTFWVGYDPDGYLHLSGKSCAAGRFETTEKIDLNEWTYLTLTYAHESGLWTLYKNGESIGTGTAQLKEYFGDTDKADAYFNGTIYFVGGQNFNGNVDEFQFWPRTLSAEEVAAAMADATAAEGITGLYTFDELDGSYYPNLSGNEDTSSFIAGFFNHSYSNGYALANGGGPDTMNGTPTPAEATTVPGRVIAQEYCTDFSKAGSNTNNERKTYSLKLTDARGNTGTVTGLQDVEKATIYFDKTAEAIGTFVAGQTATLKPEGIGSWMHSYLMIDWNKDGVFDVANVGNNGVPGEGCELMSHTGVNINEIWYDSNGDLLNGDGENSNAAVSLVHPSFVIPADVKPGVYRARYRCAWDTYDPCSPYSQLLGKNGTALLGIHGGIVVDFLINIIKDEHAMRTITIASNDAALGTVEFVGAEGTELTSTANVAIKAVVVDENAYFVNWTDAEGNEISTDAEFTYEGEEDIELTANFRQHFAVTFDGTVRVSNALGQIASGSIFDLGTELTVAPVVPEGKILAALFVNNIDVTELMEDGEYTFTVEEATAIRAEFEDMKSVVEFSWTGNGTVTATAYNYDTMEETELKSGDEVAGGSMLLFVFTPDEGEEVESVLCNGDDWTSELVEFDEEDGSMILTIEAYDVLMSVSAVFSENNIGIFVENVAADEAQAEYFNLQGVSVNRANLVPGVYVRRVAGKVEKVIVK